VEKILIKTEKGIDLPDDFAKLLQVQPQIGLAFEQMRPSCQQGYADWIRQAQDASARTRRIERALTKISKWGERHSLMAQQSESEQPQVGSIPSP